MAGIYIHIPFCKQACHYCDFHFSVNQSYKTQMVNALCTEIEARKDYLQTKEISTIYFGGGTPSLLTPNEINDILTKISTLYTIKKGTEITLEANPDDLSLAYLKVLRTIGINRLSIGIQSFNDAFLLFLNRSHSSEKGINAVQNARKAGFDNVSIDLIYGIPSEDDTIFKEDLATALNLETEHLSAYCLTIEEKTTFGKWVKSGKMKNPNEEKAAQHFELLMCEAEKKGFEHYEISNFCRANNYSKHNCSYWKNVEYLGVGPGAHSYNLKSRQFNILNNHLYMQGVKQGTITTEIEMLSPKDKVNEYLLTSIRTKWGSSFSFIETEIDFNVATIKKQVEKLEKEGLLFIKQDTFYLTQKGKLFADKVTEELFVL